MSDEIHKRRLLRLIVLPNGQTTLGDPRDYAAHLIPGTQGTYAARLSRPLVHPPEHVRRIHQARHEL